MVLNPIKEKIHFTERILYRITDQFKYGFLIMVLIYGLGMIKNTTHLMQSIYV